MKSNNHRAVESDLDSSRATRSYSSSHYTNNPSTIQYTSSVPLPVPTNSQNMHNTNNVKFSPKRISKPISKPCFLPTNNSNQHKNDIVSKGCLVSLISGNEKKLSSYTSVSTSVSYTSDVTDQYSKSPEYDNNNNNYTRRREYNNPNDPMSSSSSTTSSVHRAQHHEENLRLARSREFLDPTHRTTATALSHVHVNVDVYRHRNSVESTMTKGRIPLEPLNHLMNDGHHHHHHDNNKGLDPTFTHDASTRGKNQSTIRRLDSTTNTTTRKEQITTSSSHNTSNEIQWVDIDGWNPFCYPNKTTPIMMHHDKTQMLPSNTQNSEPDHDNSPHHLTKSNTADYNKDPLIPIPIPNHKHINTHSNHSTHPISSYSSSSSIDSNPPTNLTQDSVRTNNTSKEIEECVADIANQTMISTTDLSIMEMIQHQKMDIERMKIANQSMKQIFHSSVVSAPITKTTGSCDLEKMDQQQKERLDRFQKLKEEESSSSSHLSRPKKGVDEKEIIKSSKLLPCSIDDKIQSKVGCNNNEGLNVNTPKSKSMKSQRSIKDTKSLCTQPSIAGTSLLSNYSTVECDTDLSDGDFGNYSTTSTAIRLDVIHHQENLSVSSWHSDTNQESSYCSDIAPSPTEKISYAQLNFDGITQSEMAIKSLQASATEEVVKQNFGLALGLFEKVLKIQIETLGEMHPEVASTYHNMGIVYVKQTTQETESAEAETYNRLAFASFRKAAEVARDSLGADHPNVALSLVRMGFLSLKSGYYQHALGTFQEVLRIRKISLGSEHPLVAKIHNNIGVTALHLGMYDEALCSFDSALRIQRSTLHQTIMHNHQYESTNMTISIEKSMKLEMGDTLSNIGSLCLDWITKAESALNDATMKELIGKANQHLSEAHEIRTQYLDVNHPHVLGTEELLNRVKHFASMSSSESIEESLDDKHSNNSSIECTKQDVQQKRQVKPNSKNMEITSNHQTTTLSNKSNSTNTEESTESTTHTSNNVGEMLMQTPKSPVTLATPSKTSLPRNQLSNPVEVSSKKLPRSAKYGKIVDMPGVTSPSPTPSHPMSSQGRINSPVERTFTVTPRNAKYDVVADMSKSNVEIPHPHYKSKPSIPNDEESCLVSVSGVFMGDSNLVSEDSNTNRTLSVFSAPTAGSVQRNKVSRLTPIDDTKNISRSSNIQYETNEIDDNELEMCTFTNGMESTILEKSDIPLSRSRNDEKYQEMNDEAKKYLKSGKLRIALHLFQNILKEYRSEYGELHPVLGSTLHNIGIVYMKAGKYNDAQDYFKQAVRVRRGAIGRNNVDVSVSLVKVGITQLLLRQFDDALISFRDALHVRRQALGYLHPSTARIYNNIGCVHVEFNELKEARLAFEAALDVQRNALCDDPTNESMMFSTSTTLCNLGYFYASRGQHEKAAMVLNEAVTLQEKVLGKSHPTVLSTLDCLAASHFKDGNYVESLNCYKDISSRIYNDKCGFKKHQRRALGIVTFKMARIDKKLHDYDASLKKLEDALLLVKEVADTKLIMQVEHEIREILDERSRNPLDWL